MIRILLISFATMTFACGGSDQTSSAGGSSARPAPPETAPAQSGASAAAAPPASRAPQGNTTVTLVGCLQGPADAGGATGTSGTAARASARTDGPDTVAGAATSGGRYRLIDATAASNDSAGVGANGAGGSGGPLVSGVSSFDLDAVPDDARAHVNKQVRITGRLDPRQDALSAQGGAAAGSAEASGGSLTASARGSSAGSPSSGSPTNGMTGSGVGAGGSTPGASSGAGAATATAAPSGANNRRLTVASIQVVAATCERRSR
jgi:hypothetical protein